MALVHCYLTNLSCIVQSLAQEGGGLTYAGEQAAEVLGDLEMKPGEAGNIAVIDKIVREGGESGQGVLGMTALQMRWPGGGIAKFQVGPKFDLKIGLYVRGCEWFVGAGHDGNSK